MLPVCGDEPESRFIKAIEIGKKLTTAPQCMGA